MSDPEDSLSAGGASLRDTAKWLVGGVVATAVSVFAGSSLTNLGSLDPTADYLRLAVAAGGAFIGFIGLFLISKRAIAVLTVESLSLKRLAIEQEDQILVGVRREVEERYQSSFPGGTKSLAEFLVARRADPTNADMRKATSFFNDQVLPDASFLYIRRKFDRLTAILPVATILAIIGFGSFAWAANPPEPSAPKPRFSISITRQ